MTKSTIIKTIINSDKNFEISEEEASNLDLIKLSDNNYHVIRNNVAFHIEILEKYTNKDYKIRVQNRVYKVNLQDSLDQIVDKLGLAVKVHHKISEIKAPMPGTVMEVLVTVGQSIQKGDNLVILEAMKMENIIKAMGDGVIASIEVHKGSSVDKNEVMIKLV